MSDAPPAAPAPDTPPQATVHTGKRRHYSLIWLIPIGTLLIGAYLAYDTIASRGPTITITFLSAEGLQAGKSPVRVKDVDIGTVRTVALSKDNTHVNVTVDMKSEAKRLLTKGAKFWVVKARIFAGAVSGLETLLSGAYIDMLPERGDDLESERHYEGLEDPPVLQSDVPGRELLVKTDRIGSLNVGSPVFYHDLDVGQVLGYDVGDMAREITLHVFVRDPFDKYVRDNSQFWNASGLTASLTGAGLQVQVQSLRAVLLGGVAFDTPEGGKPLPASGPAPSFTLFKDQDAAQAASYGERVKFVAYFGGSVRGLNVGADVELRGLKIGQVTSVYLKYDPASDEVVVPVYFEVQPDRIAQARRQQDRRTLDETIADLVRRGMRAQLVSGNLITGAQIVSMDIVPDAPPQGIGHEGDVIVVPTLHSGGFESITRTASDILGRINAIPFDQIGTHLNNALAGVEGVTASPQMKDAVATLDAALHSVRDVVQKLDNGLQPTLDKLPAIAQGLQDSVAKANRLLGSYGGDSRFHQDLTDLLSQLNDTARSVRALADLLSRHPEALIRGRPDKGVN